MWRLAIGQQYEVLPETKSKNPPRPPSEAGSNDTEIEELSEFTSSEAKHFNVHVQSANSDANKYGTVSESTTHASSGTSKNADNEVDNKN